MNPALATRLRGALAETLPLSRRDGGFVRTGTTRVLDELRALRDESRSVIVALQARYAALTETATVRSYKHDHFLGHFIEVPQAQGEKLLKPPHDAMFVHRRPWPARCDFRRRNLPNWKSRLPPPPRRRSPASRRSRDLGRAGPRRASRARAARCYDRSNRCCRGSRRIAEGLDWTRPAVDSSLAFEIEAGRHPVLRRRCACRA